MFLFRTWAGLGSILGSEVRRGGFSFFWGKIWINIFERASKGMWHPAVRYIGTHVSARTSAGLGSILGSEVRRGGFSLSGTKFEVISLNG